MENEISFKLASDHETVVIIQGSKFATIALVGKWAGKRVAGNGNFDDSVIAKGISFAKAKISQN
jgi:hypothetical protein